MQLAILAPPGMDSIGMGSAGMGPFPVFQQERSRPMSSKPTDSDAAAARAEWERLMAAVVANQDRAAFAALFEYFAPRIKTFMQRSGSTEARAEELAQETMLTVWRKASLFNPASASASTWIFTIARNLRIDAFRRDRRGGVVETTDVAIEFHVDESPQADAILVTAQTGSRVQLAIAELSEDQKKVVELSFFEEKAHAEIAAILQIPLGTVKSRIRMATIKLRNLLGEPS
jgi:RNA polymerase sigma-70 factor (ECF subfamily)